MVRRIILTLTLVLCATALGIACASARREVTSSAPSGAPFSLFHDQQDGIVTIAWAFRVDDLFSCSNSALTLRHVKARFGERVNLVAVAVGDDPGLVDSYMRQQRLKPEVVRVDRGAYESLLGHAPLPSIHLITNGQIRHTAVDSTWTDGRTRREWPMERVVAELVEVTSRGDNLAAFTSFPENL